MSYRYLIIGIVLILSSNACSTQWTKSIQYGSVERSPFRETIEIEVINGLIIIPIEIDGYSYRFLFDTGAPNSISEEVQSKFNFKTVSKGYIVDSNNSRSKVNYIQIDSLFLGSIPFYEQTAFVADFGKNPLFKCLEVDGIIGSNLMRHCNWTINYQEKTIELTNDPLSKEVQSYSRIPFNTDEQYNLLVELSLNGVNVKNITIDYGSNGSLSLPNNVFNVLEEHGVVKDSYDEIGVSQTGIIGKIEELNRKTAFVDSLLLSDALAQDVQIRSNGHGLIGQKVLSNWQISIDWTNKYLYFHDNQSKDQKGTHGFSIGYSDEVGTYVQSVIVDGPAYMKGLRPGMKLLKLNDTPFTKSDGFCAVANSMDKSQSTLNIVFEDFDGNIYSETIEMKTLK